jgi:RNA polymerase sigma-70 factor (ECF subfamily)
MWSPVHEGRKIVDQRGLVERARAGDHDAFAALVGGSVARLDATAWLIVRDRELAHDVVQDALMRSWRDLPGLRDPVRFDAWLHRILVNTCLMAIRRRHRRPIEVELEPIVPHAEADPAGAVADRDELDRAFAHLDPDHRAVVVLRYFVGMPMADIASVMGIPIGTAKSRLNRALASMRVVVARVDAHPERPAEGHMA